MSSESGVSLGQYTTAGRKSVNQDFHGAIAPETGAAHWKGVTLAIADGIGSSPAGHLASAIAVKSFLEDYYATPASWSVKRSAERVLRAVNDWLVAQSQSGEGRRDRDSGYVTTLTVLIIRPVTAYLFHVGDARVYRLRARHLEPLTREHRLNVSAEKSYLSRALGVEAGVEIDYRKIGVEPGDVYLLMTDGVYEYLRSSEIVDLFERWEDDLDQAAQTLAECALSRGSPDNLTVQIARVDRCPKALPQNWLDAVARPMPPPLTEGARFDGLTLIRALHGSHRSHVYLALDEASQRRMVVKIPAIDGREDPGYLERFVLEDWIIARIDHPHVIKAEHRNRPRLFLYTTFEYIEGQTLRQWARAHPDPDLAAVRALVRQIGLGLQALDRLDIVHRDLRPDNILITGDGQVKIIDFGSARAAGIEDDQRLFQRLEWPGDVAYSAPEYWFGAEGGREADLFSLGVITYQLLSGGRLPYGAEIGRAQTPAALKKLVYRPLSDDSQAIPVWIDAAIRKAVDPDPRRRYQEVGDFLHDLEQPNPRYLKPARPPWIERDPVTFWKTISLLLTITVIGLLLQLYSER